MLTSHRSHASSSSRDTAAYVTAQRYLTSLRKYQNHMELFTTEKVMELDAFQPTLREIWSVIPTELKIEIFSRQIQLLTHYDAVEIQKRIFDYFHHEKNLTSQDTNTALVAIAIATEYILYLNNHVSFQPTDLLLRKVLLAAQTHEKSLSDSIKHALIFVLQNTKENLSLLPSNMEHTLTTTVSSKLISFRLTLLLSQGKLSEALEIFQNVQYKNDINVQAAYLDFLLQSKKVEPKIIEVIDNPCFFGRNKNGKQNGFKQFADTLRKAVVVLCQYPAIVTTFKKYYTQYQDPLLLSYIIEFLLRNSQFREAMQYYINAPTAAKSHLRVMLQYGHCLLQQKNYSDLQPILDALLTRYSKHEGVIYLVAQALLMQDQIEKFNIICEASKLNMIRRLRAQYLSMSGNHSQAFAILQSLPMVIPAVLAETIFVMNSLQKKGLLDTTIDEFRESKRILPPIIGEIHLAMLGHKGTKFSEALNKKNKSPNFSYAKILFLHQQDPSKLKLLLGTESPLPQRDKANLQLAYTEMVLARWRYSSSYAKLIPHATHIAASLTEEHPSWLPGLLAYLKLKMCLMDTNGKKRNQKKEHQLLHFVAARLKHTSAKSKEEAKSETQKPSFPDSAPLSLIHIEMLLRLNKESQARIHFQRYAKQFKHNLEFLEQLDDLFYQYDRTPPQRTKSIEASVNFDVLDSWLEQLDAKALEDSLEDGEGDLETDPESDTEETSEDFPPLTLTKEKKPEAKDTIPDAAPLRSCLESESKEPMVNLSTTTFSNTVSVARIVPAEKLNLIPKSLLDVLIALNPFCPIFFVGSAVRAILTSPSMDDIDIVAFHPNTTELAEQLSKRLGRKITVNPHLPQLIRFTLDKKIDIYCSSAASLQEHAKQCDATINTILVDPLGQVFDPTGTGLDDLRNKILRPLQDLSNLSSTSPINMKLWIFRFIRFVAQGFQLSAIDQAKLKAQVPKVLEKIPTEFQVRIRDQLHKIIVKGHCYASLHLLFDWGVFAALFSTSAIANSPQTALFLKKYMLFTVANIDACPDEIQRISGKKHFYTVLIASKLFSLPNMSYESINPFIQEHANLIPTNLISGLDDAIIRQWYDLKQLERRIGTPTHTTVKTSPSLIAAINELTAENTEELCNKLSYQTISFEMAAKLLYQIHLIYESTSLTHEQSNALKSLIYLAYIVLFNFEYFHSDFYAPFITSQMLSTVILTISPLTTWAKIIVPKAYSSMLLQGFLRYPNPSFADIARVLSAVNRGHIQDKETIKRLLSQAKTILSIQEEKRSQPLQQDISAEDVHQMSTTIASLLQNGDTLESLGLSMDLMVRLKSTPTTVALSREADHFYKELQRKLALYSYENTFSETSIAWYGSCLMYVVQFPLKEAEQPSLKIAIQCHYPGQRDNNGKPYHLNRAFESLARFENMFMIFVEVSDLLQPGCLSKTKAMSCIAMAFEKIKTLCEPHAPHLTQREKREIKHTPTPTAAELQKLAKREAKAEQAREHTQRLIATATQQAEIKKRKTSQEHLQSFLKHLVQHHGPEILAKRVQGQNEERRTETKQITKLLIGEITPRQEKEMRIARAQKESPLQDVLLQQANSSKRAINNWLKIWLQSNCLIEDHEQSVMNRLMLLIEDEHLSTIISPEIQALARTLSVEKQLEQFLKPVFTAQKKKPIKGLADLEYRRAVHLSRQLSLAIPVAPSVDEKTSIIHDSVIQGVHAELAQNLSQLDDADAKIDNSSDRDIDLSHYTPLYLAARAAIQDPQPVPLLILLLQKGANLNFNPSIIGTLSSVPFHYLIEHNPSLLPTLLQHTRVKINFYFALLYFSSYPDGLDSALFLLVQYTKLTQYQEKFDTDNIKHNANLLLQYLLELSSKKATEVFKALLNTGILTSISLKSTINFARSHYLSPDITHALEQCSAPKESKALVPQQAFSTPSVVLSSADSGVKALCAAVIKCSIEEVQQLSELRCNVNGRTESPKNSSLSHYTPLYLAARHAALAANTGAGLFKRMSMVTLLLQKGADLNLHPEPVPSHPLYVPFYYFVRNIPEVLPTLLQHTIIKINLYTALSHFTNEPILLDSALVLLEQYTKLTAYQDKFDITAFKQNGDLLLARLREYNHGDAFQVIKALSNSGILATSSQTSLEHAKTSSSPPILPTVPIPETPKKSAENIRVKKKSKKKAAVQTPATKLLESKSAPAPQSKPATAVEMPKMATAPIEMKAPSQSRLTETKDIPAGLIEVDVPADGTCLFYSIVLSALLPHINDVEAFKRYFNLLFQHEKHPLHSNAAEELRKALLPYNGEVDFIKKPNVSAALEVLVDVNFRCRVVDYIEANKADFAHFYPKNFEPELARMSIAKTFGDLPQIHAASQLLKTTIVVYSGTLVYTVESEHTAPIRLVHTKTPHSVTNNHYCFLIDPSHIPDFSMETADAEAKEAFTNNVNDISSELPETKSATVPTVSPQRLAKIVLPNDQTYIRQQDRMRRWSYVAGAEIPTSGFILESSPIAAIASEDSSFTCQYSSVPQSAVSQAAVVSAMGTFSASTTSSSSSLSSSSAPSPSPDVHTIIDIPPIGFPS